MNMREATPERKVRGRRNALIDAFEAYLDTQADEDADHEMEGGEAYAALVFEVAADITRQSRVVEVSYDRATLAVVAVYHFVDGRVTTFVDVLLYAQLTHEREVMHHRAQAAEALAERLIIAGATALARAEPSATLSYEPSTHRLVLKYPRGREVRHHVCGVPGHIVRTKNARIAEAHAALGSRLDRERADFERGRAEGEAGAREMVDTLDNELREMRARLAEATREHFITARERDLALVRVRDAIERERDAAFAREDDGGWTGG